jgi:hypothetical protein
MTNTDLFSTPITSRKVRKGIYAHKYPNGTININGVKFLCYTMNEAIKAWRKANQLTNQKRKSNATIQLCSNTNK